MKSRSPSSPKTHVARVVSKLGLRDRVQVVVFACQHGLVENQRP
jgi:DNA-binding NarL/FixJ family response regulator